MIVILKRPNEGILGPHDGYTFIRASDELRQWLIDHREIEDQVIYNTIYENWDAIGLSFHFANPELATLFKLRWG